MSAAWSAIATLVSPALRLYLCCRAAQGREDAIRLRERRGIDPTERPSGPLLWMHAASVGEAISILPVLKAVNARVAILVTTGTITSQTFLAKCIAEQDMADYVLHKFAPLDVPLWVSRFLSHWRPDVAAFVESELWPNQIAACRTRGIPLMLLNARMSDRSFRAWRRFPAMARHLLEGFTQVQARSGIDAARFHTLGAPCISSPGDLKFASPPLPADSVFTTQLSAAFAGRPTWLAASTHPGEETLVAAAHRTLLPSHPGLLTIIAPRHPNRGRTLSTELGAPLRSAGQGPSAEGIWIADTIGEMGLWYRLAQVVFVGRSLVAPGGGQNPLEPARLGCAIAVGPYTANFTEHVRLLREARGLVEIASAGDLAEFVSRMFADKEMCHTLARNAFNAVKHYDDLPAHTANTLLSLLPARQCCA